MSILRIDEVNSLLGIADVDFAAAKVMLFSETAKLFD